MEISIGALDAGAEDHRSGGAARGAGAGYRGSRRGICPVERVTWGKVRGAGCDGDSGTLWRSEARSDKTRQRQRRAGPDHGPMACGRVSLRMKMSRPW